MTETTNSGAAPGGIWAGSAIRVTGVGHYFPERVVHNTPELVGAEERFNAVDQAVIGELNVKARHVSGEEETVGHMAVRAAEQALSAAGLEARRLDLVIVTNWTDRQFIPEHGPRVAYELGARRALGFDLCGACAGFVHGVQSAAAMLSSPGPWRRAVVVSSEQLNRGTRPGSKGELVAGDAAGAVVLERGETDEEAPDGPLLIDSVLFSDGEDARIIYARRPHGWLTSTAQLIERAVEGNLRAIELLLERNGLEIEDIDWVLMHPGTDPLHRAVREKAGIDPDRFFVTMETRGNTSSASVPIALSELLASGRTRPGQLYLTPAIGSGFYEGGLLFRL
ncbi:ketoacyl-ACP synthase III [Streptomyces sp. HC44]|uniref:Ketoacyl-ACP synthase III n=1 Tax=Streptomyces scabichelini TaxID=2711217 RepID=A0A6G4VIU7_9ACTN|nr:ketoacyl-ACP synthase III [Streptomyces scabichelini]NGO13693.1 ketoacyl-ACP synthase III [Streptomyces scabichelini]